MDYYDYLWDEILRDAYAKYLDENCRHAHPDDCECMNLKEFESKLIDDKQEEKYCDF